MTTGHGARSLAHVQGVEAVTELAAPSVAFPYLPLAAAANFCGVGRRVLADAARRGEVPSFTPGTGTLRARTRVFRVEDLRTWVEASAAKPRVAETEDDGFAAWSKRKARS